MGKTLRVDFRRQAVSLVCALSAAQVAAGASVPRAHASATQPPPSAVSKEAPLHWSFRPVGRPTVPSPDLRGFPAWGANPVDRFLLAELRHKGLTPSPRTDRRTLIRRVSLDLTGLPPSPEETESFVRDPSPAAYEAVVDRLLASPQYGERQAQHWLDVVRFAETNGFELDGDRPQAWRYRDWVVRAFNADRPYDQFIREQIAGDLFKPGDFEARIATGFLRAGPRHVVGGNVDATIDRQEWLTEATYGVGTAVMGLTVNCARCHDHKFDPLPQADYYRLQAFFAGANDREYPHATPTEQQRYVEANAALKAALQPIKDEIAAIEKPYREQLVAGKRAKLEKLFADALNTPAEKRTREQLRLAGEARIQINLSWDEVVAALSPADRDRRAALRQRMHALELERTPEPLPVAPGIVEAETVPATHVLVRGEAHVRGQEVQPAVPAILARTLPLPAAAASDRERRKRLAEWLTRSEHPLTARVMVNRVWQQHFGRGLVGTPNDFGRFGESPSHPALFDYLAYRFAQAEGARERRSEGATRAQDGLGWSVKQLHRLLVLSQAYQQSTDWQPSATVSSSGKGSKAAKSLPRPLAPSLPRLVDPQNRLLWRFNRRRLDGEALRDSVLQAAGTLNPQGGGPSVRVSLEKEVYDTIFTEGEPDNLWPVHPDPRQHTRRSLYLLRKRNVRLPMLAVFDQPDMMTSCAARGESVHALQALTLLNSDFMAQQSRALAERVFRDVPAAGADAQRIDRLYLLAIGRPASAKERRSTERFLAEQIAHLKAQANVRDREREAWNDLSLAVLNLNNFAYLR